MKIKRLLVANRGEIALRVMRSAKEMGITTIAIFSEADRYALHVRYADEAVCIGPAPSAESYLNGSKIVEVAKELRIDGIHPGYGFLSENAEFARQVTEAGIIFIGPSPKSISIMGDKLSAKQAVKEFDEYDIPLAPGGVDSIEDVQEAKKMAADIGYPVMIKASAGGGGKGMRIVENEADFEEQMERAVSEAKSSFKDGRVFVEKFITNPKHIEIQVLGDQHGNIIYLFERECSIQRRNQKVIEEAPSPVVNPEMRKAMGEAAVGVAKACDYYGAGTVEFMADGDLNFYFLEMNTRLQVEHPVTELITGVDLVKEQIKIAEGQALTIQQEDLSITGHAIEVRVYAEDPKNNFLPDIGKLQTYRRPQGPGVRVDDGFEQGMEIPIYYDPMIAKLITYGKDRSEAIDRMKRAIAEYQIVGIETTLSFCNFVLEHDEFVSGRFDTKFVKNFFKPEMLAKPMNQDALEISAALASQLFQQQKPTTFSGNQKSNQINNGISKWKLNRTAR